MPAQSTTSIARKRTARVTAATIAVGTATVLALSACASGKGGTTGGTSGGAAAGKSPSEVLAASVTNLSDTKAVSVDVTFKPDAAFIAAQSDSTASDPSSAAVDKAIGSGIEFKVQISADKALKDLQPTDMPNESLSLLLGGKDYLDLVSTGGNAYIKVDVPDVLTLAGVPASVVNGELAKFPPAIQAPAKAAVAGKWLEISAADLKSVASMAQAMGGGGDTSSTPAAPGAGQASQVIQSLLGSLTKDSKVTDKGNGQLEVSTQTQTLAQDFLKAVQPLLSNLPAQLKDAFTKGQDQVTKIDNKPITFDVWTNNGALSEVSFDTAQVAKNAGGGHAPLDVKISQNAGSIAAPSGAVSVDVKSILGGLGAGL